MGIMATVSGYAVRFIPLPACLHLDSATCVVMQVAMPRGACVTGAHATAPQSPGESFLRYSRLWHIIEKNSRIDRSESKS